MLTVFYSPHSTSVDNEAGRASGHADVPLSARGQREARQRGTDYATETLDAVFCSDLQRAWRTAEIAFAARGLPIIRDARLREFDYGQLTQHPRETLALEQHVTQPFPDGESVFMAVQRVGDFLRDVLRAYDGKTIVVIGHSATKYGLEYWSGDASLEAIIRTPWEWRDVPVWRYTFVLPLREQHHLE
jgi:alpha-ribazole phosphatase/probable phosphoglycerate mutase